MNLQHLRAFFWLRWRLFINQMQRGGIANQIVLGIMAVSSLLMIVFLLVLSFVVGLLALTTARPVVLLYIWDGGVVLFLFTWSIGLLSELQRSEALSLEKFLHLPVSLSGVFVLNYLSSLLSLNLIAYVPIMAGFSLGLALARGPALLLQLPLIAAFLLMVTALTYQFQGWLASLMVNKRRRRAIIVAATLVFVVVAQVPNLVNIWQPWSDPNVKPDDYRHMEEVVEEWAGVANMVLPPGWLPLGARAAAEGDVLIALLCTAGMALIGAASLWRAYRTTVRIYTGAFTAGKPAVAPAAAVPRRPATAHPAHLLEKRIPGISEQAAAIALGSFRSLTRAPEVKMMLLTPIIMLMIFGALYFRGGMDVPEFVRPLLAFGAMAMTLLMLVQLVGNQFGFDRSGFRVYVLCPAPRRDILLGKNLAVVPLAMALCAVPIAVVEVVLPMRIDHLLALLPQFVSIYLTYCILANWLSILAPSQVAAGSLKATSVKLIPALLQMVFLFSLPTVLAPALVPLGIEFALDALELVQGVPFCLILSLVYCAAIIGIYWLVLPWQGSLLQAREQRILDIVTTKSE